MQTDNRRRRLLEYRPLEATKEERYMKFHEETQKKWKETSDMLAKKVGRDPATLAMNSEDAFRRMNEERYLISQVVHAIATKDIGAWTPNPRIGDLYAQPERSQLRSFEMIRNPNARTDVEGARPTNWFESKYYKKRVKQLRSYLDKIKPHEPDFDGLVIAGKPLELKPFKELPKVEASPEVLVHEVHEEKKRVSEVKLSINTNRLFFRTTSGSIQSRSVEVTNDGTTAVYYRWELAPDIDLMLGSGADRTSIRKAQNNDPVDWRLSDSFMVARSIQPKKRSEFCFTQTKGSILPGSSATFSFSFKSEVPGCFTQLWVMRTTPTVQSETSLTVSLRGCCEQEPPDLSSFKASIDDSLHQSERSRCIEEVLSSIFERVKKVTELNKKGTEERVEGDVLVDDRAPAFEAANKEWGLVYSPALYESLAGIASECWDSLGIQGFERFWDGKIKSLTAMIMKISDGKKKRELLLKINSILSTSMTSSASASLSYSIAFVQMSALFESLPDLFTRNASSLNQEAPQFNAPKPPDPAEDEEALESTRRKMRGKKESRKAPPKKLKKGSKAEEELSRTGTPVGATATAPGELSPELKAAMKETVKEELLKRLGVFEQLANESRGVTAQLTRVDEIKRLETDLNIEVEDDLN